MSTAALVNESNIVTAFIHLLQDSDYTPPEGTKVVFTNYAAPGFVYDPETNSFSEPPESAVDPEG